MRVDLEAESMQMNFYNMPKEENEGTTPKVLR